MATSAALHSDHVNYLILRYLQEHGHESTALAFHKDWHRPNEFRDPESLPFAQVVQRDTLISVIQDGLVYDELASRRVKGKGQRRWRWAGVNPREQLSEEAAAGLRDDGALALPSRPTSSGKRKGKPLALMTERDVGKGQPEGFPIPPAKRQRRSEGPEVNGDGDAMEVDDVSPAAEADEDAEAASPALSAEMDVVEVPERYDSMDVATQTEVKTGRKTSTMYWKIDKPGATVLHSIWNPAKDGKYAHSLLTVGEGLCRFYDIPTSMDNVPEINHLDDPNMPDDGVVTASAWHPDGHTAACALDTFVHEDNGKHALQVILNHSCDHASTVQAAESFGMTPAGVVLCMRYSPNGSRLLVVRTNAHHSLVQVWNTTPGRLDDGSPADALSGWQRLDRQVLDACWTDERSFIVSGADGLSSAYHVSTSAAAPATYEDGQIKQHGLIDGRPDMVALKEPYDKVRFDAHLGVVVFASSSGKLLLSTPLLQGTAGDPSVDHGEVGGRLDISDYLTALAFQPGQHHVEADKLSETGGQEQWSLLAAAFEGGRCKLYRVSRPDEQRTVCDEVTTLELPDGPALALAWSPQGTHLACGGTDLVQIYAIESLLKRNNSSRHEALVTWRPDPTAVGKVNGERETNGEEEAVSEPSLSWSADGESLGFAHERQLAVIRFRPPLHTDLPQPETNGAASP